VLAEERLVTLHHILGIGIVAAAQQQAAGKQASQYFHHG
jgi:hypothetical protein